MTTSTSPLDGRPVLREVIHESLGFMLLYAEAGQRFCEAGDDAMLECTISKLIAYTKATALHFIKIRAEEARLAALEREAA
jgi:hypothetical protein